MTTPFLAFDVALSLVRSLREPLALISRRDPKLADQLRRAAASVPLNVAEGNRRIGRRPPAFLPHRRRLRRRGRGVAPRGGGVRVLTAATLQPAQALADRELRLLRGLTR